MPNTLNFLNWFEDIANINTIFLQKEELNNYPNNKF